MKTGNHYGVEIIFLDGNTIELEIDSAIEITAVVSTDTGDTTITVM